MKNDKVNAARYEYVRTLSPVQFAEIFKENLQTGRPFDDLVDERRQAEQLTSTSFTLVHPPIGSDGWFKGLIPSAQVSAKQFVTERRSVGVTHTDETGEWVWAVYFEGTDFWADAFDTEAEANAYAAAWNTQCPPVQGKA